MLIKYLLANKASKDGSVRAKKTKVLLRDTVKSLFFVVVSIGKSSRFFAPKSNLVRLVVSSLLLSIAVRCQLTSEENCCRRQKQTAQHRISGQCCHASECKVVTIPGTLSICAYLLVRFFLAIY